MKSFLQDRLRLLAVFLIVSGFIVGCDSINTDDSPDAPSSSKNGFTARVDGIPGQAASREISGGLKTKSARNEEYMGQAFDGAFILLDATEEEGQHEYISFFHSTFEPLEVREYEIGGWAWSEEDSSALGDFEWPEFFADYVQTVDNEERLYPASSGKITITSLTDDSIEGTFSFEATRFYGYTIPDFNGEDPSGLEDFDVGYREVTLDEPLTVEGSFKAEIITFDDFCIVVTEGEESDDDCYGDYEEMEFNTELFGAEYFIYSDIYADSSITPYADSTDMGGTMYTAPALNGSNLEAWVYPYCSGGTFDVRSDVENGEARIRIYHTNEASYPDCDFSVEDQQLSLPVPQEALDQAKIVLLNPDPYLDAYEDGYVLK